jgi:hypothetical protein
MTERPPSVGVLLPVGPGDTEVARARDVVASVRRWSPDALILIVDDDRDDRALSSLGVAVLRTSLPKSGFDAYAAMTAGTLEGLRWLAARRVDLALKLDTDALVVGPFAEALHHAFCAAPEIGVRGRYRLTVDGRPRGFEPVRAQIRMLRAPVRIYRAGDRRRLRPAGPRAWRRTAGILRCARAHGYQDGEHCLGGSYAVGAAAMAAMARRGMLDHARDWAGTRASEDVVLGLITRAVGYEMADDPLFGVSWRGLAAEPEELIAQGHAIVHSVKDPEGCSEWDLRATFATLRGDA